MKGYAVDGIPDTLAFSIRNAAKDVGYYAKMAADLNAETIMSKSANEALQTAIDEGDGDLMVSQMTDFFARRFGR